MMTPEELLTKKNIPYILSGKDLKIRCLNPDHDDRSPSLRIDKHTGVMNCLSCPFSGQLHKHFGIQVSVLDTRRQRLKDKIGLKLAENVGLDMPENAVMFDQDFRGISAETYKEFEAFQHSDKEFVGRIVFPVRNVTGKINAFIGRHMTKNHDPRYIIHPRHVQMPVYPLHKIRPLQGRIIIVEGIFDMLNLWDKGLHNVICGFGTRTFTGKKGSVKNEKLELLKMYGIYGIDICFDPDDAGQEAAKDLKFICENHDYNVRNINLKTSDAGDLTASKVLKLKEMLYDEDSSSNRIEAESD